ncbi:MAG: hypothetical protein QW724_07240 [Nitrososphaerota archaeon]
MSRVVIISAWKDLVAVKVLDSRSNTICFFNKMENGSEGICVVKEHDVYIVVHDDFKDVVECSQPPTVSIRIETPTPVD